MNASYINGSWIEKLLQAFTWMLVHSLWQGLLLALMSGCMMLIMRKSAPDKRYTALVSLLVGYLLGCAATFVYMWDQVAATAGAADTAGLLTFSAWEGFNLVNIFRRLGEYCTDHALLITAIWFVIFAFRCWQMMRAIQYVRKVKSRQVFNVGGNWQQKLDDWAQQLGVGKAVTLLESGITKVPVVIGHLRPVIYMPVGLLANLPAEQVEAVLMHELAHIRRNDYLFNWVQHIAETIFFFNPGMLWVSSLLREEREHCCDDIALTHTGNKKQFIQALITFKEQVNRQGDYAMAFPGKKSQLLQRVTRIVHNRNNAFNGIEKGFLMLSAFICLILLATFATGQKKTAIAANNNEAVTSVPVASQEVPNSSMQSSTAQQVPKPAAGSRKPKKAVGVEGQTAIAVPVPKYGETNVVTDKQQAAEEKKRFEVKLEANVKWDGEQEQKYLAEINAAELQRVKAEADRRQADIMHAQAEKDRKEADRHREQTAIDQAAAERHREQAELHRQQAEKDRAQSMIHAAQAERDRQRATKDRERAEMDRAKAELDRQQAEQDRARAEMDRRQAEKRREELAEKWRQLPDTYH